MVDDGDAEGIELVVAEPDLHGHGADGEERTPWGGLRREGGRLRGWMQSTPKMMLDAT